jgi:SAM-dependent methyltransferase
MRETGRTSREHVVAFDEADAELAETLDNLDDADRYRQWIYDLIEPYLGDRILEVGAGHGTFTALLAPGRHVTATDLSERCVRVLHDRYDGDPTVTVQQSDLAQAVGAGPFDTVVLINVLEHISEDSQALSQVHDLLRPGGRVLLWVPAFDQLYSEFDRRIGHHRRYTVAQLQHRLLGSGFTVDEIRYVNALGALAWWLVAKKLRRTPTGKLGVRIYDRVFVPIVRRVEERWRPPVGQSILAIASRET